MSKKNETIILILALIATLGLVGIGLWWLISPWIQKVNELLKSPEPSVISTPITPSSPPSQSPVNSLENRLSFGEKLLIPSEITPDKNTAAAAFASKNYPTAIQYLERSLTIKKNDPETIIYLNNARIGNQKSYAIAASVPIGSDVNAAQEMLRGVAQAQQEINSAGGINNIPLKVLIADDNDDEEIAKQVAQALVNNSEILGVIGHFGSGTTIAAAKEVYQPQGLVMISPTSTSTELSGIGNYIFRTVPNDRFAGEALAKYMFETLRKQKATVFFNSKSSYSNSLKNVFTTAVFGEGGEIITEIDLVEPNFNAVEAVKTAKEEGAEVLMLAMNTATLNQALWIISANQNQLPLLGGDSAYKPQILQLGGKNAEGMVIAVPWHILGNQSANFPKQAQQLWGAEVNWRTAMAYDAAKALITALKSDPTRTGIQKTLSNRGFSAKGAGRDIRFFPSGDRNQPVQLVRVQSGNRSSYGYDFEPIP